MGAGMSHGSSPHGDSNVCAVIWDLYREHLWFYVHISVYIYIYTGILFMKIAGVMTVDHESLTCPQGCRHAPMKNAPTAEFYSG